MSHDLAEPPAASFAAQAFLELRGEVSLMRRATERLTDERVAAPDYAPTLEEISKQIETFITWGKAINDKPAMKVTPENLAAAISRAATASREQDQQLLERAAATFAAEAKRLDAMIVRARSAEEQDRELRRNRIGFAVGGMLLFAILPGAVARSLPVSWAAPEWIAARMLGLDMWRAGEDMLAKADPARWRQVVASDRKQRGQRGSPQASR